MERRMLMAIVPALLAALLLTACGARTWKTPAPAETTAPAETPKREDSGETDTRLEMLPGLDAAALRNTLPEADYAAFAAYLPVLEGTETFRWVAGPYDGYPGYNWESFDAGMKEVRDRFWEGFEIDPPDALTLDRLAVQDLDGDGAMEMALLFQDGAYRYLVLRMEDEDCCGTSFGVRWFEGLQTNGVYWGSGGAGSSTYYRMTFRDGVFQQQELGSREEWAAGSEYKLGGELVTKERFDAWRAEHLPGEVTWYGPDGSVIPENQ